MPIEVKEETLNSIFEYRFEAPEDLSRSHVFTLPAWFQTWWKVFGEDYEPCPYSVWQNGQMIGIAPLMRRGPTARLIGNPEVCDYLDFITVPGREKEFLQALFPALQKRGFKQLELNAQRPDAAVFCWLSGAEADSDYPGRIYFSREDQSYELALPDSWESYLAGLSKKQRHEVRRKLRRLEKENTGYRYRIIAGNRAVQEFLPRFFDLVQYNPDKVEFFTDKTKYFFRCLVDNMAGSGLARFGLLEIDGRAAAAVFYFDYRGRIHLYNSGYDTNYRSLSVGLLSKVLLLKNGIEQSRQVFDFLKGQEIYKGRLGGTAVPIYRVKVEIDP